MNRKCLRCGLVNYLSEQTCVRCGTGLGESENISPNRAFLKSSVAKRGAVCVAVLLGALLGFYGSLVLSADSLDREQQRRVWSAIQILEQRGFTNEVLLLKHFTVFRSNDNWLNASVEKENAYAATNFPFEIITVYPDFFTYPVDDTERAAILLHEAKHLEGKDEKEAYEFVWRNRKQLGWDAEGYDRSLLWRETRKVTREYVPAMFACDSAEYGDCTE
ncbi:MAG TPA: hypothetical protein VMZ26_14990 [Pyrinomonadaceae bacterium]|nr:hypothetical protein [Pyrinomonadaceae bacterium]